MTGFTPLSSITASPTVPNGIDTVVGVNSSNLDRRFSISQISSALASISRSLPPAGGNIQVFVATTGSDSNSGSAASPFATIQHALNYLAGFDWQLTWIPSISVANGTYSIGSGGVLNLPQFTNLISSSVLGTATPQLGVQIIGNISSPSSVILDFGNLVITGIQTNTSSAFRFDGFQFQSASDICWATGTCQINFDNIIWNVQNSNFNLVNVSKAAQVTFGFSNFNMQVTGSAATFLFFVQGTGRIDDFGCTWTISNPIATSAILRTLDNANIVWPGSGGSLVNPGNLTGQQYIVNNNSTLEFHGLGGLSGDRSTFPGTTVGVVNPPNRAARVSTTTSYQKAVPLNGSTVNIFPGKQFLSIVPAGGLASLTVALPSFMSDGEIVSIGTTQTLTSLTVSAQTTFGSTPTVVGAPTTLAAGSGFTMLFDSADNAWYMSD